MVKRKKTLLFKLREDDKHKKKKPESPIEEESSLVQPDGDEGGNSIYSNFYSGEDGYTPQTEQNPTEYKI